MNRIVEAMKSVDRKQSLNLLYFLFAYTTAVICAGTADHPVLNEWFFLPLALFSAALTILAAIATTKGGNTLLHTDLVLPVLIRLSLRTVALTLPGIAILAVGFFLADTKKTDDFISRLGDYERNGQHALAYAEISKWTKEVHTKDGYAWGRVADFYLKHSELQLALNASDHHVRQHKGEEAALTQRASILSRLNK